MLFCVNVLVYVLYLCVFVFLSSILPLLMASSYPLSTILLPEFPPHFPGTRPCAARSLFPALVLISCVQ